MLAYLFLTSFIYVIFSHQTDFLFFINITEINYSVMMPSHLSHKKIKNKKLKRG
jgi:hypothetical protein